MDELPAATTLDVRRFQKELENDLKSALEDLRAAGRPAHIQPSSPERLCGVVRTHLKAREGLDVT